VAAIKKQADTIGGLIDKLYANRKEISDLEAKKKALKKEAEDIESRALSLMDAQGTTRGAGKNAQALVNDKVTPHVVDWDKFYEFIHENRFYHLLHRRPSSQSCVELFENGEQIPGVEKFTKRQVNLRST
jgi:hypothetical protein